VCGEFISGRGQDSLARLGLLELIRRAGAIPAKDVEFCSVRLAGKVRKLPQPALCLPRRQLDPLLAARFRELDGELREGERWRDDFEREGVVLASGRRLQPVVDGWRWFGLKAHATSVATSADLEMHVSDGGYVGLCRQPGGLVNVCGLFRRRSGSSDVLLDWQERLRGPAGSMLRGRMRQAVFTEGSFCAVAGINLTPQRARHQSGCRIGDALTMIPPVTGNGMSMAFESAEIALAPLSAWSRDEATWAETRQSIARGCDAAFARRLAWAKWLQRMILTPVWQGALVRLTSRSEWFWRLVFARTR
jgi:2-polyprenyl-6-methoxyphenol hydroxylase-like FAD-dependent oxidoreductase